MFGLNLEKDDLKCEMRDEGNLEKIRMRMKSEPTSAALPDRDIVPRL